MPLKNTRSFFLKIPCTALVEKFMLHDLAKVTQVSRFTVLIVLGYKVTEIVTYRQASQQ